VSSKLRLLVCASITIAAALTPHTATAYMQASTSCTDSWGEYIPPTPDNPQGSFIVHAGTCTTSYFWVEPEAGTESPIDFDDGGIFDSGDFICPNSQTSKKKGNPIDISIGAKLETEVDFQTSDAFALSLVRNYSSLNQRDGLLGRHWETNFDYGLIFQGTSILANIPTRGMIAFTPVSGSTTSWKPSALGVNATLTKGSDGVFTLDWKTESVQRYSSAGKILSVKSPNDLGYNFTYNTSGYLDRVTSTGGRFLQFTWTGSQLTRVTDAAGSYYDYTYLVDRFGPGKHLLSHVNPAATPGDTVDYYYENAAFPGALTGKKIGASRYSWFGYDATGLATSTEHRTGSQATTAVDRYVFTYSRPDANTLVVNETNPLGKKATYRYVGGELESVTGLPSASCPASLYTRTHDANGYPDKVTDFNDNVIDYDYDAQGFVLKEVFGAGTPTSTTVDYVWDTANARLTSRTVQGDHRTSYTYNAAGRVLTETVTNLSANGVLNQARTTTYSYTTHPNGMLASITEDGPLPGTGDAVMRSYNSSGDLLSVSDALGVQVTFSNYNGRGQPAHAVYRNGAAYDFAYDARGRLTSRSRTIGASTITETMAFDGHGNQAGQLSTHTHADGVVETFYYDGARRQIRSSLAETLVDYVGGPDETVTQDVNATKSYDAASNVIATGVSRHLQSIEKIRTRTGWLITVKKNQTTGEIDGYFDYNELGQAIGQRGNNGQNVRLGRDETGYVTSYTDSLGRTMSVQRDSQNRVTKIVDAKAGVTLLGYDAAGRITSMTDPRGLVTKYNRNGFGDLVRLESPETGITTYAYDAYGRKTGETRADLGTFTYGYDSIGRLTSAQSGSETQTYVYDSCANGLGSLCSMTDASGTTSFTYAPGGVRFASQVTNIGGTAYTTSYLYDAYDRLTRITYPDGKTANYEYADGHLRKVHAGLGAATQTVVDTMRFEPSGEIQSLVYGNGLVRKQSYDQDGRLVSIKATDPATSTDVQSLQLTWNANNSLVGLTNGRSTNLTQTFGYDELGRLASTSRGDGVAESFGYDSASNRTSYGRTGQAISTLGYSTTSNRLLSSGSRVWTYDDKGNSNGFIGLDGVAVGLSYNAFGRIASSSRQSLTTAYLVNGFGQRVSKSGPAGTTRFIFSPDGTLLAELGPSGWTNYIHGEGELLARVRGGAVDYVHTDQVGRPEVVTNAAKGVTWAANNYAFERTVSVDTIGGLNIGFPGQYYDQETGLWQNVNREFDASVGRYIQSDPIGQDGGQNTYLYASASPTTEVDPSGKAAPLAAVVGICAATGALGYAEGDSVKAAIRDFNKKQSEDHVVEIDPCDIDTLPIANTGGLNGNSTNGASTVANGASAAAPWASKGATVAAGIAVLKYGARASSAVSPCFWAGVAGGLLFGNGSVSDKIEKFEIWAAHQLSD
jgi:RHS repeat-associated protein